MRRRSFVGGVVASTTVLRIAPSWAQGDPLPSWNDGAAKAAIVDFVGAGDHATAGADCRARPERIATFDNDGTLWGEQPIYFQFAFALDRVKALAPKHPEWKQKQPFKRCWPTTRAAARAPASTVCSRSSPRPTPA